MFTFVLEHKLSSIFALILLVLVLPSQLFGQVDTGSISGTVKDTSGGTIAGAAVVLINEGTGASLTSTTSSLGDYISLSR